MLDQVRPRLRNADELHDLLLSLVAARPHPEWAQWFDALAADGRAGLVDGCWVATERREAALALADDDEAAAACVAGHLQLAGPVTVEQLVADAALPSGAPMGAPLSPARARTALARLEGKGSAIELPDGRWCAAQPAGAAARRQSQPAAGHGRRGADRRVRALPHALAARDARQPRWRAGPDCSKSSSSCRGSRRRRPSGRPRSSRPA